MSLSATANHRGWVADSRRKAKGRSVAPVMVEVSPEAVWARLLRNPTILFIALAVAFGGAGLVVPDKDLAPVNVALLFCLVGAGLWSGWRLVVGRPIAIMTPLPWFLVSSVLYFGLGPLVNYFGDTATLDYVNVYYRPTEWELWRGNILNLLGVALVLVSAYLVTSALASRRRRMRPQFHCASLEKTAIALMAVGLGAWGGILKPAELGLLHLPSSAVEVVTLLAQFRFAGLILLTVLVVQGRRKWAPALVGVAALLLISGVLDFSKYAVVFPILMLFVGVFLVRPRVTVVAVFVVLAAVVYVSVYNLVQFGRKETLGSPGYLNQRVDAVIDYRRGVPTQSQGQGGKLWWSRLCYSSAEAFAMSRYDSGFPGSSVELGMYTFIPRLLWPTKPILTPGTSFNEIWAGSDTSQSTPSVFGELYWNGGWELAVLGSLFMGVVFGFFSDFTVRFLAGGRYLYLPIALMGVELGRNFLDWFGASFVGAPVFAAWIYLFLSQVLGKVVGLERRKRAPIRRVRSVSAPPPQGF
jgi:hypothetical protein